MCWTEHSRAARTKCGIGNEVCIWYFKKFAFKTRDEAMSDFGGFDSINDEFTRKLNEEWRLQHVSGTFQLKVQIFLTNANALKEALSGGVKVVIATDKGLSVYGRHGREILRSNFSACLLCPGLDIPGSQDHCHHQALVLGFEIVGISLLLVEQEANGGRASVVQAGPNMLEIVLPGTSKGSGVKATLDHLGVTAKEIRADLMPELASPGIALGNGSEKTKAAADVIGASNDEMLWLKLSSCTHSECDLSVATNQANRADKHKQIPKWAVTLQFSGYKPNDECAWSSAIHNGGKAHFFGSQPSMRIRQGFVIAFDMFSKIISIFFQPSMHSWIAHFTPTA
ncbi:hypothetical protein SADUNF_Sadunf06G0187700 [Salix dunnii]|uniref:Uncharacterized protein n=1 Tax=Salix dunnii TaxID=1413687 RepID=A0A835KA36_9ROSI|nr:hypothetical protein SADUNF_Sadunf06G0187700 [Salix dunnii]